MPIVTRLDIKTFIGGYCVSTVDLAVEHLGGMRYETCVFPADGKEITDWIEVWGQRYHTYEDAQDGHVRVCDDLEAGRLETWDGGRL